MNFCINTVSETRKQKSLLFLVVWRCETPLSLDIPILGNLEGFNFL